MNITEGLILGLSTGPVCLAYCGPVLASYLLGEGHQIKKNTINTGIFLSGRLLAYIITGLVAGMFGKMILQPTHERSVIMGIIYIILASYMVFYGFYGFKEICLGKYQHNISNAFRKRLPGIVPFIGGIITGLNICPPFLIAISRAADAGNISRSIMMFIMFFIGTSIYFVLFPFAGIFRNKQTLRIIGKYTAILAGLFYFWTGITVIMNN
jgi:sulfite exporter TauE/SafE